jgi:hypothetical protein
VWLRTAASVLCVVLWSGCLVTDEITFNDEPDLPPEILSSPSSEPIGGVFWVDKSDRRLTEVPITVGIRDENVRQGLTAHWRLRRREGEELPMFVSDDVPAGDEPVRDFTLHVQTGDLVEGECHRLELAVSGSFYINKTSNPIYFDKVPEGRESDVTYAWWLIWEGRNDLVGSEYEKLVSSCIASENFLNAPPPTMEPLP